MTHKVFFPYSLYKPILTGGGSDFQLFWIEHECYENDESHLVIALFLAVDRVHVV